MLWDMSWEPVGKFESMEPAEILLEYSRMKRIKRGLISPIWKLSLQRKIFQTALGLCLGERVNWVAQSKQMGSSIQTCFLAACCLFSSICPQSSDIGRWKSKKKTTNKQRPNKERIETENGSGIAFHGLCRRWGLRRIAWYITRAKGA